MRRTLTAVWSRVRSWCASVVPTNQSPQIPPPSLYVVQLEELHRLAYSHWMMVRWGRGWHEYGGEVGALWECGWWTQSVQSGLDYHWVYLGLTVEQALPILKSIIYNRTPTR